MNRTKIAHGLMYVGMISFITTAIYTVNNSEKLTQYEKNPLPLVERVQELKEVRQKTYSFMGKDVVEYSIKEMPAIVKLSDSVNKEYESIVSSDEYKEEKKIMKEDKKKGEKHHTKKYYLGLLGVLGSIATFVGGVYVANKKPEQKDDEIKNENLHK
ncbi:MAG: hypothetical protein ABIB43_05915 [archaeon]